MSKQGLFITLEGGEGCGKSTMMPVIEEFFTSQGYQVVCTREPGGTKIAEQIRNILLTKDESENLCATSELLLMYAARAQLVTSKIKPLLEQGKVVISDRFDLSSVAYQGYGRGISLETIAQIREIAIGDFKPDLTLLFDLEVKVGLERAKKRSAADRFEQESLDFFNKVRQGFLEQAPYHAHLVSVIDSAQSIEQVKEQVIKSLIGLLPKE